MIEFKYLKQKLENCWCFCLNCCNCKQNCSSFMFLLLHISDLNPAILFVKLLQDLCNHNLSLELPFFTRLTVKIILAFSFFLVCRDCGHFFGA